MKSHKGEKNHCCSYCKNKYVTAGELNSHMKHIHSHKKPYKCLFPECAEAFLTKKQLNLHYYTHSPDNECNICENSHSSPSLLHNHLNLHYNNDNCSKCLTCFKIFDSYDLLKNHKLVHSKIATLDKDMQNNMKQ